MKMKYLTKKLKKDIIVKVKKEKGKSKMMKNVKIMNKINNRVINKIDETLDILHTHTHTHTHTRDCLLENNGKVNTLQILNKGSTVLNLWRHRAIFGMLVRKKYSKYTIKLK